MNQVVVQAIQKSFILPALTFPHTYILWTKAVLPFHKCCSFSVHFLIVIRSITYYFITYMFWAGVCNYRDLRGSPGSGCVGMCVGKDYVAAHFWSIIDIWNSLSIGSSQLDLFHKLVILDNWYHLRAVCKKFVYQMQME